MTVALFTATVMPSMVTRVSVSSARMPASLWTVPVSTTLASRAIRPPLPSPAPFTLIQPPTKIGPALVLISVVMATVTVMPLTCQTPAKPVRDTGPGFG